MINKKLILNLLYLFQFSSSYKLNTTFYHESAVNVVCKVKINLENESVDYLASGTVKGTINIWDVTNVKIEVHF
jgi:hypothetical protein